MRNIVSSLIESLEARRFLSGSTPAAPSALIETNSSDSAISLTWTDNSTNETGFRIDRWNGHSWGKIAKVSPNVVSFTNTHLKPSRFYAYRVFAFNKAGNSTSSAFIGDASTFAKGTTVGPLGLKATAVSANDIILQFKDIAANEAGHNIQVSVNEGAWEFAGGVQGTNDAALRVFDYSAAQPGKTYSFRVAAYTNSLFYGYSLPVAVTASMPNTKPAVLAGGQHYTSDVQVIPGIDSPEPIHNVFLHLLNADGTPDTVFSGTGSGVVAETVNSDQQPAQFLSGLPNGYILSTLNGEIHHIVPGPPAYYTWFESVDVLAETSTSLFSTFETPHTSNPQSAPSPLKIFVQPNGQILILSDGVTNTAIGLNTPTPEITVLDDLAHLVWTHPFNAAADSVVGLPNDLVAVRNGNHVVVFDSTGQQLSF